MVLQFNKDYGVRETKSKSIISQILKGINRRWVALISDDDIGFKSFVALSKV